MQNFSQSFHILLYLIYIWISLIRYSSFVKVRKLTFQIRKIPPQLKNALISSRYSLFSNIIFLSIFPEWIFSAEYTLSSEIASVILIFYVRIMQKMIARAAKANPKVVKARIAVNLLTRVPIRRRDIEPP